MSDCNAHRIRVQPLASLARPNWNRARRIHGCDPFEMMSESQMDLLIQASLGLWLILALPTKKPRSPGPGVCRVDDVNQVVVCIPWIRKSK